MGRVEYDPLEVGLTDAADLNDTLTAIAVQSAALSGPNFAEEGLDQRSFVSGVQAVSAFRIVKPGAARTSQVGLAAAFVTLDDTITTFLSGPFTLNQNDVLKVVASVPFASGPGPIDGIPSAADIRTRLRFEIGGGGAVVAVGSNRRSFESAIPWGSTGYRAHHGIVFSAVGGVGGSAYDFFELQIADLSGGPTTVNYGGISFYGIIYRRTS